MNIGSQSGLNGSPVVDRVNGDSASKAVNQEPIKIADLPSVQHSADGVDTCDTQRESSLPALTDMKISIPTAEDPIPTLDKGTDSVQEQSTPQGGANSIVSEISPSTIQEPKASEDNKAAHSLSRHPSQGSLPAEGTNTL
ncbi:hypothetical protein [Endozoicomonas ascidiicola]|nr:hypothetical protein [Endozoicomonas ascidiicola]